MTEHRAAMLLLVEAFHYEYFRQGSELARCGDGVPRAACWLRFQCVIRGQAMRLHVEHVECRADGDGLADKLTECVSAHVSLGDPLGVPAEAAEDLGDYDGPLEIPLRW